MKILAHRGISAHFLENTLQAFQGALDAAVDGIELDVHQVENDFVIYHDFNLSRLGKEPQQLQDLTLEEVREIELETDHKIPFLEEVLNLVNGQCLLNLEIKQIKDPEALLSIVRRYIINTNGHVIFSSFNHPLVCSLQQLVRNSGIQNNVKFGALIGHLPNDLASFARTMQVDIAGIDVDMVNAEFVKDAHINFIEVFVYTVNTPEKFINLKDMGIDGVFSNDPQLLSSLL